MNPASNPQIAIPRSRFRQEFTHTTSWLHGDLIPLDCFEIVPGDDYSVHKAALEVIMSTPIAPIFGNIKLKAVAMFCPTRLLWEHTEEFYGANKTSAGPQTGIYKIPRRSIFRDNIGVRSVSHYLGKPVCTADSSKINYGLVSVLKERGYYLCWSEWYRSQQLQNPFILDKSDNGLIGSINGTSLDFGKVPLKVCKQYDMFTSATIGPQYGAAVTLPLGSYAPIIGISSYHSVGDTGLYFSDNAGVVTNPGLLQQPGNAPVQMLDDSSVSGTTARVTHTNIVADLSTATAAKINDIRYAFQLQKYLERANFGTRSRL